MFCLNFKCFLEMNLLIETFFPNCSTFPDSVQQFSKSSNQSKSSSNGKYTLPQVAPPAQPTQWKMCQHEEIPRFTWIFLISQSDVI